jgi:hypothetical protein
MSRAHRYCRRCGRQVRSLREIQAELASGERAAVAEAEKDREQFSRRFPNGDYGALQPFAFGWLTSVTDRAAEDLACHAGTCTKTGGRESP